MMPQIISQILAFLPDNFLVILLPHLFEKPVDVSPCYILI